ncbi:MAG: NAD(P)/FAD-dependent oxidoreductase [Candidatus Eremiobacteraeota bacterium]|nr:NAD(P)/FAD-dependent oxidoreductase [Candidatus Eremiobacteraeota bacterium]
MVDVAIVGAGPAGSSCAYRLAHAGHSVHIFERAQFPRTKVCGEYLGGAACGELREIGVANAVAEKAYAIRGIRLHTPAGLVELPFPAQAWSLARTDLDQLLLDYARSAGAQITTARVEAIQKTPNGARIEFRDASGAQASLEARVVVGADGLGSVVARAFDLLAKTAGNARFAVGGHYTGFQGLDHFIETYVGTNSYFAINPLSNELANVMVVVDQAQLHEWKGAIDERLQTTARELAEGKRDVAHVHRVGKRVAVGPLVQRARRVATPGVYLIGDASGFVDPFTGQGVFLALKSAALAASAIGAELREHRGGTKAHRTYQAQHHRVFSARSQVTSLVSLLIKTPWLAKRATRNLQRSPALRDVVMETVGGYGNPYAVLSPLALMQLAR